MYTCNGLIDIFGFLSCKNTVSTCDQIMRIKNSMQFHFQKIPMQLSAKHVRCSYTMFMFSAVLKTGLYIMCMLCYAVIGCITWTLLCLKIEIIYIFGQNIWKCIIGSPSYKHSWSWRNFHKLVPNILVDPTKNVIVGPTKNIIVDPSKNCFWLFL